MKGERGGSWVAVRGDRSSWRGRKASGGLSEGEEVVSEWVRGCLIGRNRSWVVVRGGGIPRGGWRVPGRASTSSGEECLVLQTWYMYFKLTYTYINP